MDSKDHVDERYHLSALTGRIIAAAQEVYNTIGPGFEEKIYKKSIGFRAPCPGVGIFARSLDRVYVEKAFRPL